VGSRSRAEAGAGEAKKWEIEKVKNPKKQKSKIRNFAFCQKRTESQKCKGSRNPLSCLDGKGGKAFRLMEFQCRP
jgi:hypothetical protein